MSDDLKLKLQIDSALNPTGLESTEAWLARIKAEAAESVAPVEELGSAAALTGTSILAIGSAVAFLLPLLIRWISHTKDQSDEQKQLSDSLTQALPYLERYKQHVIDLTEAQEAQLRAARELAAVNEDQKRRDLPKVIEETSAKLKEQSARVAELNDTILKNFGAYQNAPKALQEFFEAAAAEERKLRAEMEGAKGQLDELNEAIQNNTTVEAERARRMKAALDAEKEKTHTTKEDTKAIREREAALKRGAAFEDQQAIDASLDMDRFTKKFQQELKKREKAEADYQTGTRILKKREEEIDDELLKKKQEQTIQTVGYIGMTLGALSTMFGQNKELAIAGAIVDTVAASVTAFKIAGGYPLGVPALVATIAQGMAQVQAIRQTDVGFDDPFADLTARKLGRKSAVDFVANFGAGFHGGMAQSNSYSTTINRGVNVGNVTVPGFMGAGRTEFMKHLRRELIKAERLERRTTLGR